MQEFNCVPELGFCFCVNTWKGYYCISPNLRCTFFHILITLKLGCVLQSKDYHNLIVMSFFLVNKIICFRINDILDLRKYAIT